MVAGTKINTLNHWDYRGTGTKLTPAYSKDSWL